MDTNNVMKNNFLFCFEPFEEHHHSYNHGSLPTFIPNRHARHFRQEKERAPSSLDTYIVDSSQDTMREAKGRRSRTPRGGRRAGSRMSNMSNVTKAPICRIDAHARPGRGMSGIIVIDFLLDRYRSNCKNGKNEEIRIVFIY